MRITTAALLALAVSTAAAYADAPATRPATAPTTFAASAFANPNPARYLFEDQLKPGMKGYGLTVMKAGKIERFNVEIIDVIRNFSPGHNAILVRCSGLGLEHSGVIAGMSGSPVYIDDKMIGAIAFGWGASKDPIAGIQPIRQMLDIPVTAKRDQVPVTASRWSRPKGLPAAAAKLPGWSALLTSITRDTPRPAVRRPNRLADPRAVSLHPLQAPLMASGLSPRGMKILEDALDGTGLVPLNSGSAGATLDAATSKPLGGAADLKPREIQLAPGSSIAIPLLTGDADLAAIGTVTEVTDKKVWAFGHAMLADGPTSLPISTGYIYTIMPSLLQSFKVGASFEPQGALVTDEQTGIVGLIGQKPTTTPITLTVKSDDGGVDKTYHYQLAQHPKLSAEILGSALESTLTAQRQLPAHYTAHLTGQLAFQNGTTIKIDSEQTAESFGLLDVMLPIAVMTDNPWGVTKLKSVDVTAKIDHETRSVQIKSVTLKRDVVAPGDDVVAIVEIIPYQQPAKTIEVRLKVPADTPDGDYELSVGGAQSALSQESNYYPQRFTPDDLPTLAKAVQHILDYRHDRLYARLILDIRGAAKGTKELKNLPASRVAMLASDQRTDTVPLYASAEVSLPMGAVVDGPGETFTITVDKDAHKRFRQADKGPPPSIGPMRPRSTSLPHTTGPKPPKGDPGDGGDGGDGGDNPFE